jgi:hypothetical protein
MPDGPLSVAKGFAASGKSTIAAVFVEPAGGLPASGVALTYLQRQNGPRSKWK